MSRALGTALAAACETFDEVPALKGHASTLTYRELLAEGRAIAAALDAAGLAASEPVHVRVSNQPRDIAALLGVWLAGGVAVPVHRTTPPSLAAQLHARTGARLAIDDGRVEAVSTTPPPARPLLDGAAFVIFTSGSTGEPKGVVVAHDAFHAKLRQIDGLLQFGANERALLVLNITFSFGLWVTLITLFKGGTLVMHEKFEPATFLDALADHAITRVGMVPTMMRVLFADARHDDRIARVVAAGTLKQILIGGESLGRSLADAIRVRFAGTDLIDIYGLTETATCDFFAFPSDYALMPGCIGRPSPQVTFRIADDEGREVAPAHVGELQVRSPFLMKGYLDAPDLTAAAYDGAWFRTGDLARVSDHGLVELMGRRKEVISRGGNKVTPMEIEQVIGTHPDVAAAMATGIADPVLGERIHVLVVARHGATIDLRALQAWLESRLERYKHPDRWYVASELPLGRTGKADRGALRALIAEQRIAPLAA